MPLPALPQDYRDDTSSVHSAGSGSSRRSWAHAKLSGGRRTDGVGSQRVDTIVAQREQDERGLHRGGGGAQREGSISESAHSVSSAGSWRRGERLGARGHGVRYSRAWTVSESVRYER
jgi:hypothetical protein